MVAVHFAEDLGKAIIAAARGETYGSTPGWWLTDVACWAHTRRKFHESRETDPTRAHTALAMIRLLYDVEGDAKDIPANERRRLCHSYWVWVCRISGQQIKCDFSLESRERWM